MSQKWHPERVLTWLRKKKGQRDVTSRMLVRQLGMSRQTAVRLLAQLVDSGKLYKTGSTRAARYSLNAPAMVRPTEFRWSRFLGLKDLSEDEVFTRLMRQWTGPRLSDNPKRILAYAFTEMLNNAIDHSRSAKVKIDVQANRKAVTFAIRDFGIGIFRNIRRKFDLADDMQALEHLLKGKQTTAPGAHSGQGIFFTSKISDFFEIRSGCLRLAFDNVNPDVRVGQLRRIQGTNVRFSIKTHTRKRLKDVFESFANEEYEFDRTRYPVIVLQQVGTVSRSQAKRLTVGLEEFARVILDFSKVKELGQGFADELFRIYQRRRPDLVIEVRNANPAVHFMIERAKRM